MTDKEICRAALVLMLKDLAELQVATLTLLSRENEISDYMMSKQTEMLEGWLQDLG